MQKKFLGDPSRYVGITVRTGYDEVELRGKGFIYIGSDKATADSASSTKLEGVWTNDSVLTLAVIHELGHVFGIPHVEKKRSLMNSEWLELLTGPEAHSYVENLNLSEFTSFFLPRTTWKVCPSSMGLQKFVRADYFDLPAGKCIEFYLGALNQEIRIYTYDETGGERTYFGRVDSSEIVHTFSNLRGVVLVLTPNQSVFPTSSKTSGNRPLERLNGPSFVEGNGGGRLVLNDGKMRFVHLAVGPDYFEISGEWNQKYQPLVSFKRE